MTRLRSGNTTISGRRHGKHTNRSVGGVSLIKVRGAWAGKPHGPVVRPSQISEAAMKREPIGTVLVGPSALLREGLARILGAAGFRILASASGVDDPVLSSIPQEQSILLIIDVSDDFDTALG